MKKLPPKGKAVEIKNVKKEGPSMKGAAAGGMKGRPKSEGESMYGKPRGSSKDCY